MDGVLMYANSYYLHRPLNGLGKFGREGSNTV